MSRHLRIAICIFPQALPLDFIGPQDIFNTLKPGKPANESLDISIDALVVGETLQPIELSGGLKVSPDLTYEQAVGQQWNAVLVPGGGGARPWAEGNAPTQVFLKNVVPGCEYVFTVCTGSWLLAHTGLLQGQKATTNKAAFKSCVEHTASRGVEWVPKARWVVSNRFWTSSGVTAGIDMAAAFLRQWVGAYHPPEVAEKLLGVLEVTAVGPDDDPWAEFYGLA